MTRKMNYSCYVIGGRDSTSWADPTSGIAMLNTQPVTGSDLYLAPTMVTTSAGNSMAISTADGLVSNALSM
jgi:hypothetical protein